MTEKIHTDEREQWNLTKISHQRTPLNLTENLEHLFRHIHTKRLVVLWVYFEFFNFGHIQPFMLVLVVIFIIFLAKFNG